MPSLTPQGQARCQFIGDADQQRRAIVVYANVRTIRPVAD